VSVVDPRISLVTATSLLLICLAACGGGSSNNQPQPSSGIHPTTTLSAETSNNTSAADSFTQQTNGNAAAGNISKLPIQSLLYSGATTKIYAHLVGWFGGSSHMNVGYHSDDANQVHRQVTDMMSRGIAGVIIDWNGPSSTTVNTTAMLMKTEAESRRGQFQFAIMEDAHALSSSAAANHCDVTDQIIDDLNTIAAQFSTSSAYLRLNGRPVIFFFDVDTYYIDWTRVASSVSGNPIFLFRGKSGLGHAQADGAFQWADLNSPDPFDMELGAQDQFYTAAAANPSQIAFGSAYAGFNDTLAAWSTDRFIHQSCGQTWLDILSEVSKFYSSSHQLQALQLVTWNDYEEGTAIESGIDNCIYLTPSVLGNTLHWSVAGGNENTVDHYTVFISADGQNLQSLGDVPSGIHSFDLSQVNLPTATYKLYVKAVGQASFQNKMSPVIAYQRGDQAPTAMLAVNQPSSLTLNASTDGSSDPDGTVTGASIDFGDGTVLSGPHATHTYSAAGVYTVVATITDNTGASAVAIQRVSVKSTGSGVTIFSPADGATINWPTTFIASGNSANPVTKMSVLVDGQSVYAANGDTINTALKINHGTHHITVQATDGTGATSSSSIDVTAEPDELSPIAVVTTILMPQIAPNAVLACTTGSKDPDGFINAQQIKFSDGTTSKSWAAVHTFAAPGTYSVTTTVTDQFGASDSASDTFTVGSH
jgi:PKD repeat protein